jgi:hypothetical protein
MMIGVSDWGAIGERAVQDYDLHNAGERFGRRKIWLKKIGSMKIFIA